MLDQEPAPPPAALDPADRKVHGSGALAALLKSSPAGSDGETGSARSASAATDASRDGSAAAAPVSPVSTLPAAAREGRKRSRLALLACFGAPAADGGAPGAGGGAAAAGGGDCPAAEAGIRPSFYWLDPARAQGLTGAEREAAAAAAAAAKSDCQDDVAVIEGFGGDAAATFAGVFDGHGPWGREAAKFAAARVPAAVAAAAPQLRGRGAPRRALAAMRAACRDTHAAMTGAPAAAAGFDASMSGTTACFALVARGHLLVASVGDSRAVLARRPAAAAAGGSCGAGLEAVQLTADAKPDLPAEARRIAAAGGAVARLRDADGAPAGPARVFAADDGVLPGLAMSRSLGDAYAHAVGVSCEPALAARRLAPGRDVALILATDGLWDVVSSAEAADFVGRYRGARCPGVSCAEALALEAQERWKRAHPEAIVDDVSVAVVHLEALPEGARAGAVALPPRLPRAAASNDGANALLDAWRAAGGGAEEDPSNHEPRSYFDGLYADDAALRWPLPRPSPPVPVPRPAAAAAAAAAAAPPASPPRGSPAARGSFPATPASPLSFPTASGGLPPPPGSSWARDVPLPRVVEGRSAEPAAMPTPSLIERAGSWGGRSAAADAASLARPIRKAALAAAKPSTSNLAAAGLAGSLRSFESLCLSADGPASPRSSVDGGGEPEGKVRAGMPRALSLGLASSSVESLPGAGLLRGGSGARGEPPSGRSSAEWQPGAEGLLSADARRV